ncbi:C2H2-type zinc finger transcription factor [Mucor lusitanicus CBS 277.49]|uniref:C2H2-type zinc finger transcription factor n=1 Tax=Mucor lusitanicus CBS 277.49 TaxID=747725 RepID=A0A168MA10_MUCCL|nr:C2H2-type zinc finger transcription factor [Mucor lusitanicus CBS 277.49]
MKLRDRKKHVMDSIKQEDCKPSALTTAESPAFITANTNTSNLTIKQEDATKDQTLLLNNKHGDEFGTKECRFQCDICNQRMPNRTSVLEHRFSIHNIKSGISRTIKDINIKIQTSSKKSTFSGSKEAP